eukprot:2795267-Rhodomonas_salina.1
MAEEIQRRASVRRKIRNRDERERYPGIMMLVQMPVYAAKPARRDSEDSDKIMRRCQWGGEHAPGASLALRGLQQEFF